MTRDWLVRGPPLKGRCEGPAGPLATLRADKMAVATIICVMALKSGASAQGLCTPANQQSALLTLYNRLGGASWTQSTPGWVTSPTTDPCGWFGVSCCTPTTCTGDPYCQCTVGMVTGIHLENNNLSGPGFGGLGSSAAGDQLVIEALGCSLLDLELQNNLLTSTLPLDIASTLPRLRSLNAGGNSLGGSLPSDLNTMTALQYVDLSSNRLGGVVPSTLCGPTSPLSDLILLDNQFTGLLDISSCVHLFILDAANNTLTGSVSSPTGYNQLHVVHLSNTSISNVDSIIAGGHITDLDLDLTHLNGTVLPGIAKLGSLQSLTIRGSPSSGFLIRGTIPPALLTIGSLTTLSLANNWLTGSLPVAGTSGSLTSVDLSDNGLSGTIPSGLVQALSKGSSNLDLRLNYLSCCGVGPLIISSAGANASYASYNLSAPRLPSGLKFSSALRPVIQPFALTLNQASMPNLGNTSYPGLSCPYLLLSADPDQSDHFLPWYIDPEYFLFEGCLCNAGLRPVTTLHNGLPLIQCLSQLPVTSSSTPWWNPWAFVIIACVACLLILIATWYMIKGYRPVVLQNFLDSQRRSKGPPTSGTISIVTTDIEGFSDLMKAAPDLMMPALLIHNNLIQKAKFANFGFTVEQEGDAYSIVFEKPGDAVKFCLHAQQLLAKQKWPRGLFTVDTDEFKVQQSRLQRAAHKVSAARKAIGSWTGSAASMISSMRKRSVNRLLLRDGSTRGSRAPSMAGTSVDGGEVREDPLPGISPFANHADEGADEGDMMGGTLRAPADIRGGGGRGLEQEGSITNFLVNDRENSTLSPRFKSSASHLGLGDVPGGGDPSPLASPAQSFTSNIHQHMGPSVKGLKVRMGIATGTLLPGQAAAGSQVLETAKVVGDAGAGGQVLMCSRTFQAIKDLTGELGCVTEAGLRLDLLDRPSWWSSLLSRWFGIDERHRENEAVLLDMGEYMYCPKGTEVPALLTAADLMYPKEEGYPGSSAKGGDGGDPSSAPHGNATTSLVRTLSRSFSARVAPTMVPQVQSKGRKLLRIYQVLSPRLVERGRLFGSKLALKDEWVMVDSPYFDATGTISAALSPCDVVTKDSPSIYGGGGSMSAARGRHSLNNNHGMPLISMVFCMVDGGKQYASKNRQDAHELHMELVALIKSALRQIPGGYFVRQQDGDLKYLVAFSNPEAALYWCISMQMVCMYVKWPQSALKHWPTEDSETGELLFRGPRLKMGMCEGFATSVLPDHMGRADYHGASINQAARFMDAAAHGGQVACEEEVAVKVSATWDRLSRKYFDLMDKEKNRRYDGNDEDGSGSGSDHSLCESSYGADSFAVPQDDAAEEREEEEEEEERREAGKLDAAPREPARIPLSGADPEEMPTQAGLEGGGGQHASPFLTTKRSIAEAAAAAIAEVDLPGTPAKEWSEIPPLPPSAPHRGALVNPSGSSTGPPLEEGGSVTERLLPHGSIHKEGSGHLTERVTSGLSVRFREKIVEGATAAGNSSNLGGGGSMRASVAPPIPPSAEAASSSANAAASSGGSGAGSASNLRRSAGAGGDLLSLHGSRPPSVDTRGGGARGGVVGSAGGSIVPGFQMGRPDASALFGHVAAAGEPPPFEMSPSSDNNNGMASPSLLQVASEFKAALAAISSPSGLTSPPSAGAPNRASVTLAGVDRLGGLGGGEVVPSSKRSNQWDAEEQRQGLGIAPPTWELPDLDALARGVKVEVTAIRLGQFKFKGSDELLSIVNVVPTSLLARKYPSDPPKGKGGRVAESSGAVAYAEVPMLRFIDMCREQYEDQRIYGGGDEPAQQQPTAPNPGDLRQMSRVFNQVAGRVSQSVSAALHRRASSGVNSISGGGDSIRGAGNTHRSQFADGPDADRRTMAAVEEIRARHHRKVAMEASARGDGHDDDDADATRKSGTEGGGAGGRTAKRMVGGLPDRASTGSALMSGRPKSGLSTGRAVKFGAPGTESDELGGGYPNKTESRQESTSGRVKFGNPSSAARPSAPALSPFANAGGANNVQAQVQQEPRQPVGPPRSQVDRLRGTDAQGGTPAARNSAAADAPGGGGTSTRRSSGGRSLNRKLESIA